jgi:hypothetical protein
MWPLDGAGRHFTAAHGRAGRRLDAQAYPAGHHLQHLDDHVVADDDLLTGLSR